MINWVAVEIIAKEQNRTICIGKSLDYTTIEKREMAREADERGLLIRLGNHELNDDETDDELYVNARSGGDTI